MKGNSFALDMSKIDEIDHQLKFIRTFCNHAKHADPKRSAGLANITLCATLPAAYPMRFDQLALHGYTVSGEKLLADVIAFWRVEIPA